MKLARWVKGPQDLNVASVLRSWSSVEWRGLWDADSSKRSFRRCICGRRTQKGSELGLRGCSNRTGSQTLIYFASLALLIGMNMGDVFKNCLQLRSVGNKDNNTNLWLIRLRIQKVPGRRAHTDICTYEYFLFRDTFWMQSPRAECEGWEAEWKMKG